MTGGGNTMTFTDHSRSRLSDPAFATRAIHHACDPAGFSNAFQPPVFLTSTYGFESVAANDAVAALDGKLYGREHNPATGIGEARFAKLEGAEAGLAVASGRPPLARSACRCCRRAPSASAWRCARYGSRIASWFNRLSCRRNGGLYRL